MKKFIPATLAVTAVLAFAPAFAGEITLHANGETTATPMVSKTTTVVHTDTVTVPVATTTSTTSVPVTTPVQVPEPTVVPAGTQGMTVTTTKVVPVPVTTTTTTTTHETVPAGGTKVDSYILQDGTNVIVVDKQAFVVDKDGMRKPAPDGNIVSKDGVSLKIRGGTLVTDTVPGAATTNTSASGSTVITEPAVTTPAGTMHNEE